MLLPNCFGSGSGKHVTVSRHLVAAVTPLDLFCICALRQDPVIDDIEAQITKATGNLKTNNVKLKGLVHKMANARNFCCDIILLTILLAIGAYIYSMFM